MKIIADEAIPFVRDYFSRHGELVLKPGRSIVREDVIDGDILLVRSVTSVNEDLLKNTAIKFVGTVTTGIDHLDIDWLDQAHIAWQAAAGYNAIPVSDYIVAVIAALSQQKMIKTVGIVGVGYIGSHVADRLKKLGFTVILHDPLRALHEPQFISSPLSDFCNLDVISLHVPLTFNGPYPTYHLINQAFLDHCMANSILINSSRGAVVDFSALNKTNPKQDLCFDVWEGEPQLDGDILKFATIATPHLAGYSVQCRYRGIDMIYQYLYKNGWLEGESKPALEVPRQELCFNGQQLSWQEVVLAIFNPLAVTQIMKKALLKEPEKCATLFDQLRENYIGESIQRHEFGFTTISEVKLKEVDRYCLIQLGINIKE
jgi:erythronate-4-phosphate dehydrogenase